MKIPPVETEFFQEDRRMDRWIDGWMDKWTGKESERQA
jgi:hypothetical protein